MFVVATNVQLTLNIKAGVGNKMPIQVVMPSSMLFRIIITTKEK